MQDVVFFTLFRTDNPYSSISLSMARELVKKNRVFYVQHPYSLKDVVKGLKQGDSALRSRFWHIITGRDKYEQLAGWPENFVAVQPPASLPVNWLPPGRLYDYLQAWNNRIVLRTIGRVLKKYNITNYIFINCYDPFFAGHLPESMGAQLCIYHCIDDITQNAYTARHGERLENEAVAGADLTLVTSTNLYKLKAPYARRLAHYFNAADTNVFEQVQTQKFERPSELEGRNGKVIGFIGNLDELRIDYPLLLRIARANPDKTLLLVGPINSPEVYTLGLDKQPNIVFAGSKKLDELPAYLQYMDCALIPFLCNTLTRSIYPLKINEYLAAGKPVVSTAFSEDIRTFSPYIYLAETADDFLQQLQAALAESDPAAAQIRLDVARSNNWEARIRLLWELVNNNEEIRQPVPTSTETA